jgi:hypothetical protein
MPPGEFAFAVIGLNNGRPFTNNDCFWMQYQWARTVEPNPDVYINLDFPRAGRSEALYGPYGRCSETDDWCRGYNYGWNLASDAVWRAGLWGIRPGRFWFDVEVDNHWSDSTRNNAQVVRGALDYFSKAGMPMGIYGTRYQWGLITGGHVAPGMVPLWVAGARTPGEALRRCDNNTNLAFAGGIIWMAQYYPEGAWDGNVLCPAAQRENAVAASGITAATPTTIPPVVTATPSPAPSVATATPTQPPRLASTLEALSAKVPEFGEFWRAWSWLGGSERD